MSLIGAGIKASYRNLLAGAGVLRALGAEPCGVATSSFRITWVVERGRLPAAVGALHAPFVDDRPQPVAESSSA